MSPKKKLATQTTDHIHPQKHSPSLEEVLKVLVIFPPFLLISFHALKESLEARAAPNAEMAVRCGARQQGVAQPAEVGPTLGAGHLVAPFCFLYTHENPGFIHGVIIHGGNHTKYTKKMIKI